MRLPAQASRTELLRGFWVSRGLQLLRQRQPELEQRLRQRITAAIEARAAASIQATTGLTLEPGVALFDRSRQLWAVGPRGQSWFAEAAF